MTSRILIIILCLASLPVLAADDGTGEVASPSGSAEGRSNPGSFERSKRFYNTDVIDWRAERNDPYNEYGPDKELAGDRDENNQRQDLRRFLAPTYPNTSLDVSGSLRRSSAEIVIRDCKILDNALADKIEILLSSETSDGALFRFKISKGDVILSEGPLDGVKDYPEGFPTTSQKHTRTYVRHPHKIIPGAPAGLADTNNVELRVEVSNPKVPGYVSFAVHAKDGGMIGISGKTDCMM